MSDIDWIVEGGKAIITTGNFAARRVTITKVTRTRVTTSDSTNWRLPDLDIVGAGSWSTSHLVPPDDPGGLRRLDWQAVARMVDRGVRALKDTGPDVDPADIWRQILADVKATGKRRGWTETL